MNIGIPKSVWEGGVDPQVLALFSKTVAKLKDAGHTITPLND